MERAYLTRFIKIFWFTLSPVMLGCTTTVYLREKTAEPPGGVVAVRGYEWEHTTGPTGPRVADARETMADRCGRAADIKVTSEGVEPT